MGPNYRAQLSSLMRVQTCNLSFTSPDLPHYTSFSRLLLLLFLSQPETHCSSTLFPVSLSRSSHKCSLSLVGLAGSAGRALLARRASGAVVARWLVAACEGWRKYTRLKYQLGIQTHPWTKKRLPWIAFLSFVCLCGYERLNMYTLRHVCICRVFVCLDTRPVFLQGCKRSTSVYNALDAYSDGTRMFYVPPFIWEPLHRLS